MRQKTVAIDDLVLTCIINVRIIECVTKKRPICFLKIVPIFFFPGILGKNKLQKPQKSTIHNIF